MSEGDPTASRPYDRRSMARLAAVQALYQIEFNRAGPDEVIDEFMRERLQAGGASGLPVAPDRKLFAALVKGTCGRRDEIDRLIGGALADGWTLDRLELLVRTVLRCGVFELLSRPDIPAPVVIDEYVDVAGAFFERGEPGLVNGVLDRLAGELRPADVAAGTSAS